MLWITQEAIEAWAATRRSTPGGQTVYSDSAIQTCLICAPRSSWDCALPNVRLNDRFAAVDTRR
jgi:hypothetical protein